MGCLWLLFLAISPRLVLFLLWITNNVKYVAAYSDKFLLAVLGFFFMPYTTLAYVVVRGPGGDVSMLGVIVLAIAVMIDVGAWGGGAWAGRSRMTNSSDF